jgi:uncharacterized SAM-binding protein YcdF (DUF218 family)
MTYIQPFFPLLLLTLFAAALGRGNRSRRMVIASAAALFLWAWPPMAWVLTRAVESGYPLRTDFSNVDASAIVALADNVQPPGPGRPEAVADSYTYVRAKYAAWLYRNWRPLPILVCGGKLNGSPESAASLMRRILIGEGVPASMVWTEDDSKSTYENALLGSRILRSHGVTSIALVTHAFHMRRSERSFQRQGIRVFPAPAGYSTFQDVSYEQFVPNWRAVQANELTMHELGGLLWYHLRGRV